MGGEERSRMRRDEPTRRELAVLKRAFNLGMRRRLVKSIPYIELFPEPPPREGHYEQDELVRFLDAANAVKAEKNFDGRVVADIVMFAYFSGWRLKECLNLHKDLIKVKEQIAVLPGKNQKKQALEGLPVRWQAVGDDSIQARESFT